MPFSDTVKTEVFLRCDRRCCKCRKSCGTNIEAAHIVAEADDGSNTAENCVPLCFDRHADIGHYNARHPKGNSFKPAELRAMRDATFAWVAEIRTAPPAEAAPAVSELELKVLDCVRHRPRVSAPDVARQLAISIDRAEVCLDGLSKARLIDWFGNMSTKQDTYAMNNKGRRLLLDRGIIQ